MNAARGTVDGEAAGVGMWEDVIFIGMFLHNAHSGAQVRRPGWGVEEKYIPSV